MVNSAPDMRLQLSWHTVNYEQRQILRDVDVALRPAEVLLVLGNNGAGKSTLLKAVAGLVTDVSGGTYLDGEVMTGKDCAARVRAGMAYLPQSGAVFATLSVRENIEVAISVLAAGAVRRANAERELAQWPRLDAMARRTAEMLPGGLRRILAIACVFARNPKLLLLDEPFAGLDDYHSAQLRARIADARQLGSAFIIAEHRTRSISESLVSRSIEVQDGKLEELLNGK